MVINVSLALQGQIIIQHQENVNYVHQDSLIMKLKENAHVLSKLHFYTKTVLASTVSRHIFGTLIQNLVMLAH